MRCKRGSTPDKLIEQACELAGTDDFGDDDGWRDNLAPAARRLRRRSRPVPIGVEIAAADMIMPLRNRLQITAWRKEHPEVAEERIERPIVIMGQPRTGTTILYDLLAQDPDLRAPLTWEVDQPFPVPQPETYETDPRIAETQAQLEMVEQLMPGFMKFHPMNARFGQECVRITGGTFCSMIFPTQYRHAELPALADVRGRPRRGLSLPPTSICSTCSPVCPASGC